MLLIKLNISLNTKLRKNLECSHVTFHYFNYRIHKSSRDFKFQLLFSAKNNRDDALFFASGSFSALQLVKVMIFELFQLFTVLICGVSGVNLMWISQSSAECHQLILQSHALITITSLSLSFA